MPRSRRLDYPGAKHHLIGRGARRAPIFSVPGARDVFLELLSELPQRFGMTLHAYALMGNHYHLLVTSPERGLSAPMQRLDQCFTQRLNSRRGWDGPVFRGRYTDVLVCEPAHWDWLLAYVHLNPERAGLADRVSDPKWTSHAAYLGQHALRQWVDPSEFLRERGGEQRYAEWIAAVSRGRIPPPASFAPESPVAKMSVVPVPRVGLDPIDLLSQVEAVAGRAVPHGRSRDPLAVVAAWWLALHGVRHVEIGHRLGIGRYIVGRRVAAAVAVADAHPVAAGWMAGLSGADPRPVEVQPRTIAA